jgi:putative ABC transport system permease protein
MNRFLFLLKFSYRNLGRNPLRTLIMALGLCFATGYIIFALNFSKSGSKEIIGDFLAQYAGTHQVVHEDYYGKQDKKSFDQYKLINDSSVASLSTELYTRRVTLAVYLSGPQKTLGTLLTGIDVESERKKSKVKRALSKGSFLNSGDKKEILLGEKLARKLGVQVNDEIAIIGQSVDGSVANDLFTVVGLMNFGGGDLEENLAFTSLESSQSFASIPSDQFHLYVSFSALDAKYPAPPIETAVVPWREILPEIFGSMRFIDIFTWIVAIIIVTVISLGMGNTLMITFLERQKEFHGLNIIGIKSSWIVYSLAFEVLFLGLMGIGAGIILGNLVTYYFHFNPINMLIFTGGKPIMMGGMAIIPKIRLWFTHEYSWKAPLLVLFFLGLSLIFPIKKVIERSRRVD